MSNLYKFQKPKVSKAELKKESLSAAFDAKAQEIGKIAGDAFLSLAVSIACLSRDAAALFFDFAASLWRPAVKGKAPHKGGLFLSASDGSETRVPRKALPGLFGIPAETEAEADARGQAIQKLVRPLAMCLAYSADREKAKDKFLSLFLDPHDNAVSSIEDTAKELGKGGDTVFLPYAGTEGKDKVWASDVRAVLNLVARDLSKLKVRKSSKEYAESVTLEDLNKIVACANDAKARLETALAVAVADAGGVAVVEAQLAATPATK